MNGNWNEWTQWTKCSVSCAGGSRSRMRVCDNPAPQHGGESCAGNATDTGVCGVRLCPVEQFASMFNETFEVQCPEDGAESGNSTSVGNDEQSSDNTARRRRRRSVDNPTNSSAVGTNGTGSSNATAEMCQFAIMLKETLRTHGNWSMWSDWTECTVPCGGGDQSRNRSCNNPLPQYGGNYCVGNADAYQECNMHSCSGIDECAAGSHNCDSNANCSDSEGSFSCSCSAGYTGNGTTCYPSCTVATCPTSNGYCADTSTGAECKCDTGYLYEDNTCKRAQTSSIKFSLSKNYLPAYANKTSPEYLALAAEVEATFHAYIKTMNITGYRNVQVRNITAGSVITELGILVVTGVSINTAYIHSEIRESIASGTFDSLKLNQTLSLMNSVGSNPTAVIDSCTIAGQDGNCHGNATCTNNREVVECARNFGHTGNGTICLDGDRTEICIMSM